MIGKDTRRGDKFNRAKKHFKSGKYKPRTAKDKKGPRVRPAEDTQHRGNKGWKGTDRRALKRIAAETLQIIEDGQYETESYDQSNTEIHNIKSLIRTAKKNTITYRPETLPIGHSNDKYDAPCEILVVKNTTLEGARLSFETHDNVGILNFASAKNPGGGFIKGSSAQEESIARSSALYECIKDSQMYIHNRSNNHDCLYSHYMIHSPDVPVFRDDNNDLIPPYCISVLTVPAVNTKQAIVKGISQDIIDQTMEHRMDNLMSVAVNNGLDSLVLGAWGCGVFGGDFNNISRQFLTLIRDRYSHSFKTIVFALLSDKDIETIQKNIDHVIR